MSAEGAGFPATISPLSPRPSKLDLITFFKQLRDLATAYGILWALYASAVLYNAATSPTYVARYPFQDHAITASPTFPAAGASAEAMDRFKFIYKEWTRAQEAMTKVREAIIRATTPDQLKFYFGDDFAQQSLHAIASKIRDTMTLDTTTIASLVDRLMNIQLNDGPPQVTQRIDTCAEMLGHLQCPEALKYSALRINMLALGTEYVNVINMYERGNPLRLYESLKTSFLQYHNDFGQRKTASALKAVVTDESSALKADVGTGAKKSGHLLDTATLNNATNKQLAALLKITQKILAEREAKAKASS